MPDRWESTTHDWRMTVDEAHLRLIASQAETFAPGGTRHLLHEVLAYVADEVEAVEAASRRCDITVHGDGSFSIRDYGRGTDTRRDDGGHVVRKPVMATKDLRFFDAAYAPALPDGRLRRGMSVVAALSEWLVHENRRLDGGWRQRYERGIPVDELTVLEPDGTTGTLVHFRVVAGLDPLPAGELASLQSDWPVLEITYRHSN